AVKATRTIIAGDAAPLSVIEVHHRVEGRSKSSSITLDFKYLPFLSRKPKEVDIPVLLNDAIEGQGKVARFRWRLPKERGSRVGKRIEVGTLVGGTSSPCMPHAMSEADILR